MNDNKPQEIFITENVTARDVDIMFNNFIKITSWVLKGTESEHAMPATSALLAGVNKLNNLQSLVATMQQEAIKQNNTIDTLQADVANLTATVKSLSEQLYALRGELTNTNAEQTQATAPTPQPVPEPVVSQPAPVTGTLVDFDDVVSQPEPVAVQPAPAPAPVSAHEEAVTVTAAAIDAGNIDPSAYEELDNTLDKLLAGVSSSDDVPF